MTDLAEFLGTVIALNLLFGIPLLVWDFPFGSRCRPSDGIDGRKGSLSGVLLHDSHLYDWDWIHF